MAGLFEALLLTGLSGVQVLSTLPHSSLVKAAGVLGIGRANVKDISSESDPLHIDMKKLEAELFRTDMVSIVAISMRRGEHWSLRNGWSGRDKTNTSIMRPVWFLASHGWGARNFWPVIR